MRRKFLLGFLVLFVIVGLSLYSKDNKVVANHPVSIPEQQQRMTASTPVKQSPVTTKTVNLTHEDQTITKTEIKDLHDSYPDQKKLDDERRQNPHSPSRSMMSFAERIGPLMEKAFKSESDAFVMTKELSACANDSSIAAAARAVCVTNTERLGETYTKIYAKAKDLRAGVSPEVQKILDTNDSVIKK
jgi:hypothetical protein